MCSCAIRSETRAEIKPLSIDGAVETIDIGLTAPTRSVAHVARLIDLKLDALAAMQDAGFGFEAIGLAVTRVAPMPARQIDFNNDRHLQLRATAENDDDVAALIDALRQRLGSNRVRQFEAVPSHIPERAEKLTEVNGETFQSAPPRSEDSYWPLADDKAASAVAFAASRTGRSHPPSLKDRRGVCAGAGDLLTSPARKVRNGSPRNGGAIPHLSLPRKRGGKEGGLTRDYYFVEDGEGHRFWLYREGLYGRETAMARWFVHGLFA